MLGQWGRPRSMRAQEGSTNTFLMRRKLQITCNLIEGGTVIHSPFFLDTPI